MARPQLFGYDKNPSFVPSGFRYFAAESGLQQEQAAEKEMLPESCTGLHNQPAEIAALIERFANGTGG
jgi:hypothetical protein